MPDERPQIVRALAELGYTRVIDVLVAFRDGIISENEKNYIFSWLYANGLRPDWMKIYVWSA